MVKTAQGYRGVAAVIDKDLTASLLARRLNAQLLLISTPLDRVSVLVGTPQQQELVRISVSQARHHLSEGHFKAGSMRPKIEGGLAFIDSTGGRIVITKAANIVQGVLGQAGTQIVPD